MTMWRREKDILLEDVWPNCSVADCGNKACIWLSYTLCFPHIFGLQMDEHGIAIFPDKATAEFCLGRLHEAQEKNREG